MDEVTHDKLECIDKKLTQICSQQERLSSQQDRIALDITELKIETELNKNNLVNQNTNQTQQLKNQQDRQTALIRAGKVVVIVAWSLFGVIILMAGIIVKQQVNFDNSSDLTQQQEINSINERLIKVEVLSGTTNQPIR